MRGEKHREESHRDGRGREKRTSKNSKEGRKRKHMYILYSRKGREPMEGIKEEEENRK